MRLERASSEDFAWLLGRGGTTRDFSVAPDLAPPEVIEIVSQLSANWLMVVADELVGIIGLKTDEGDRVEIGYGVAASREGHGLASAAVGALLPILQERGVSVATAETSVDNPASRRVLERNGFARTGERIDESDGPLITWERSL